MPRLVFTAPGRNPQPYRFQLDRQIVTMGRGSENDIVLDDGSVSVQHAIMERLEGGYRITDLGSTNGTKLEGKRQEKITLRHGLSIKLGDVAFDFTLTQEERAALHREKPEQDSPIIREEELDGSDASLAPSPRRSAPPRRLGSEVIYEYRPNYVANFLILLLFLVLAGAAFLTGMWIRYTEAEHNRERPFASTVMESLKKPAPAASATEETEESTGSAPAPAE